MGSKDKFWFKLELELEDDADWLFKFPTANTGGHWAEKIAYEVASRMQIWAAVVELAEYRDTDGDPVQGSISKSFTNGFELYHGNQVLVRWDKSYQDLQKFRQSGHTLQRILESMKIFSTPTFIESCREKLVRYFILDALIGNVDRHHENWGILRRRQENGKWEGRLAPTFDHASSLGRELQDSGTKKSRERYIEELGISHYSKHAHGAVYIDEAKTYGPSPLDLVRWGVRKPKYRPFFQAGLSTLDRVPPDVIEREIIARIPEEWMSPTARRFVIALLDYNYCKLKELRT